MLDTSPKNLTQEILAGEELRDKRLASSRAIFHQYVTNTYEGNSALDDPENHAFEYITLIVPQMIFENPVVSITSTPPSADAAELEYAQNYWIRKTRVRDVGIQLAIDQCISWGVARIDQRAQPQAVPGWVNANGSMDMPMMPQMVRVPQNRHAMDSICVDPKLARWHSFMVIRDKDSLIREAKDFPKRGWNLKAIEEMATGVDLRKARPNRESFRNVERNELVFYEVWIPEEELDESLGPQHGFHGTIRTIACGRGGEKYAEIRKPRPYYGPPTGPAVVFGTHVVPDEPWPMSALYPVQTQVKDLNNHSRAIREAAARRKRLVLGDAFSANDAKRINAAKDGEFLLVKGLDKQKVAELGLGGIDEAMAVYRNMARDLLDKNSSLSDALRGAATGDATATENAIASGAADVRMAFVKRQYQAHMRDAMERAAWFLHHDDRTAIQTGAGQLYIGGSVSDAAKRLREMFPGVEIPDDYSGERVPFETLDVQIEPASMERFDQAQSQRNAMQFFQLVSNAIPLMAQFPDATDWRAHFDRLGKAFGEPGLSARVFPDQANENFMAVQALGATPVSAGQVAQPRPGGRPVGQQPADRGVSSNRLQRRVDKATDKPRARNTIGQARTSKVGT
jgi:hypothetical protein